MSNFFTNPKQFINLLTTTEDCINIFPKDQARYVWDFTTIPDADWICEVEWVTVVVDRCRFDSDNKPNFAGSLVIGYFEGGMINFGGDQDIVFPSNMYTGPILPASETNIPITIVNIQWIKNNGETFNRQVLAIQNWTPGIRAGDPTLDDDYIAIEVAGIILNTATVELELLEPITVYEQTFRAKLICDVPSDLAATAKAKFYARTNTSTFKLIFEGTWTTISEGLNVCEVDIPTYWGEDDTRNLPPNDYIIRGEWPGRRTWPKRFSNTASQSVIEGVPLIVNLNPAPIFSNEIGQVINITASATTASGYPVFTNTNIANTVTFSIQGTSTYAALTGTRIISTTTFIGDDTSAVATAILNVTDDLVDAIPDANTTYTLLTATVVNNVFNGTAEITRTYPFRVSWDFLRDSLIARGSTSTTLTVSTTRNFTVNLTPLTVEVTERFAINGNRYLPTNNIYGGIIGNNPQLRAYVSGNSPLINTTVTFVVSEYYTSTNILNFDNVGQPITQWNTTTFTVELITEVAPNKLQFENLDEYLKPGDSFLLAGIKWPVYDIDFERNIITTNNWNGVINPSSYYQTAVVFTIEDIRTNPVFQWNGYNFDEQGDWQVFRNNRDPFTNMPMYYPNDRWELMTSSSQIDKITWPDTSRSHYRFRSLPQNIPLSSQIWGIKSPYFIWNPSGSATNKGIKHFIYAVNYANNTVITYASERQDSQRGDTGILASWGGQRLSYEHPLEVENINQWAYFYDGFDNLIGTSTNIGGTIGDPIELTLGNTATWKTNIEYPNQQYQDLHTQLAIGRYVGIRAVVDYSNLVQVLNNRIGNSVNNVELLVYPPRQPLFSATLEDAGSNWRFKAKLFKPIAINFNFLAGSTLTLKEGSNIIATGTNWQNARDSSEITIDILKNSVTTVTNVVGDFSGTLNINRWDNTWPKYSTSTVTFTPIGDVNYASNIQIISADVMPYDSNQTIQAFVTGLSANPDTIPLGIVNFIGVNINPITNQLYTQTASLSTSVATTLMNTKNLHPSSLPPNYWYTATLTATYISSNNFPSVSTNKKIDIAPGFLMNYTIALVNNQVYRQNQQTMGIFRFRVRGLNSPTKYYINGETIIYFKPGILNAATNNFIINLGDKIVNNIPTASNAFFNIKMIESPFWNIGISNPNFQIETIIFNANDIKIRWNYTFFANHGIWQAWKTGEIKFIMRCAALENLNILNNNVNSSAYQVYVNGVEINDQPDPNLPNFPSLVFSYT